MTSLLRPLLPLSNPCRLRFLWIALAGLGLLVIGAALTSAWAAAPRLPASLPLKRESVETAFPSVAGIIILTLMLVSAFAYVQILRRKGTSLEAVVTRLRRLIGRDTRTAESTQAIVRVLSTVRLSPRVSLHVVQWENRSRLLACTDSGVTVLGETAAPSEARPTPVFHAEAGH